MHCASRSTWNVRSRPNWWRRAVSGDLDGPARLEITPTPMGCGARLVWSLELRQPWLARMARVTRPLLMWAHGRIISSGVRQFERVALATPPRPADQRAGECAERDVIGDLRQRGQGGMRGQWRPSTPRSRPAMARPASAPHTIARRRGRTAASTTPQASEIAPWATAPTAACAARRCVVGDQQRAGGAERGDRGATGRQRVHGRGSAAQYARERAGPQAGSKGGRVHGRQ